MGHAHTPPQLPEVTDEAGNSPGWLPWLGIGLFVLAVIGITVSHRSSEAEEAPSDDPAAEAAE
jgi:hypothetical protein